MPSLDGYSLNEKMDKNTNRIDAEIKELRDKVELELSAINIKFNELQSYIKTIKPIKGKTCQEKKLAVNSKVKQKGIA